MKINNQYLKKLLEAFETSTNPALDLCDLVKLGFNYEEDEAFAFHMQFMNDKGYIEREDRGSGFGYDKAADGAVMWSVLPLRITASGHEFLNKLTEKYRNDLLEVMYRKGCRQDKAVFLGGVKLDLPEWDDDTFWNTAKALIDDKLIVQLRIQHVFSLEGLRRAEKLLNQSPFFTQNVVTGNTLFNSVIQQGGDNAKMNQTVIYSNEDLSDLHRLIEIFDNNIDDLSLDAAAKRRVMAQIATIKAQIEDEPDPVIVKQAGRTLRNITEGAIGSLIAAAVQPDVWVFVSAVMTKLFG